MHAPARTPAFHAPTPPMWQHQGGMPPVYTPARFPGPHPVQGMTNHHQRRAPSPFVYTTPLPRGHIQYLARAEGDDASSYVTRPRYRPPFLSNSLTTALGTQTATTMPPLSPLGNHHVQHTPTPCQHHSLAAPLLLQVQIGFTHLLTGPTHAHPMHQHFPLVLTTKMVMTPHPSQHLTTQTLRSQLLVLRAFGMELLPTVPALAMAT
jgi:hypothetical protein